MDRELFEQLVSEWLDEPERRELHARIEAAVTETPALGGVRDEWRRFDRVVRGAFPSVARVDWSGFRQRIDAGLDAGECEAELDERLRDLTVVEQRVDWPRLHKRISQAVADAAGAPKLIRFPLRRAGAGVALAAAAAAALVFMLTPATRPPIAPFGFAQVLVSSPARALLEHGPGRPYARVTVTPLPEAKAALDGTQAPPSRSREPQLAEVFLMIEPARVACAPGGQMNPFGFN